MIRFEGDVTPTSTIFVSDDYQNIGCGCFYEIEDLEGVDLHFDCIIDTSVVDKSNKNTDPSMHAYFSQFREIRLYLVIYRLIGGAPPILSLDSQGSYYNAKAWLETRLTQDLSFESDSGEEYSDPMFYLATDDSKGYDPIPTNMEDTVIHVQEYELLNDCNIIDETKGRLIPVQAGFAGILIETALSGYLTTEEKVRDYILSALCH